MTAYNITYYGEKGEVLKAETVFMKGHRAVKQSATASSPEYTTRIVIYDLMDTPLLIKENEQWLDYVRDAVV